MRCYHLLSTVAILVSLLKVKEAYWCGVFFNYYYLFIFYLFLSVWLYFVPKKLCDRSDVTQMKTVGSLVKSDIINYTIYSSALTNQTIIN